MEQNTLLRWFNELREKIRSINGNIAVRLGDAAGATRLSIRDSDGAEVAWIDSNGGSSLASGSSIISAGHIVLQLGDAAGAFRVRVLDSGGVEVASINSDGVISAASISVNTGWISSQGAAPVLSLRETDAAANEQFWDVFANGKVLSIRAVNDTYSGETTAMRVTRSSGVGLASVEFPNTGVTVAGVVTSTQVGGGPASGLVVNSVVPAVGWRESDQAADERWWDMVLNGKTLALRTVNDANTDARNVFYVTRGSGVDVASVIFPSKVTFESGIAPARSGGGEVFGVDASSTGSAMVLAAAGVGFPFGSPGTGGNFSGVIIVNCISDGACGLFIVGGGAITLLGSSYGGFGTSPGASSHNLYYTGGGTYTVTLQNNTGASKTYHILAFRTRAGA